MPYSLYGKLGNQDDDMIRTNMTLSGVGSDSLIKAKGVKSVELIIETKTLVVTFFVAEVEEIGSMQINVYILLCTKCCYNG
jgi:hypothetical protein